MRRILALAVVALAVAALPADAQRATNCRDFAESRVDDNARFTAVALTYFGLAKLIDPGPPAQAQHAFVCGDGRSRALVRHDGQLVFKGSVRGDRKRFARERSVLVLKPTRLAKRLLGGRDKALLTIKFRMFDRRGRLVAEAERFISVTREGTQRPRRSDDGQIGVRPGLGDRPG